MDQLFFFFSSFDLGNDYYFLYCNDFTTLYVRGLELKWIKAELLCGPLSLTHPHTRSLSLPPFLYVCVCVCLVAGGHRSCQLLHHNDSKITAFVAAAVTAAIQTEWSLQGVIPVTVAAACY